MTHEDRWRLTPGNGFEVRHDRGNRETLDGRWIAVERLDLGLEPRIRWSEDVVALGFIARNPVLPASRRHPEAMNQHNRIGTFWWCGPESVSFWVAFWYSLPSVTSSRSLCNSSEPMRKLKGTCKHRESSCHLVRRQAVWRCIRRQRSNWESTAPSLSSSPHSGPSGSNGSRRPRTPARVRTIQTRRQEA